MSMAAGSFARGARGSSLHVLSGVSFVSRCSGAFVSRCGANGGGGGGTGALVVNPVLVMAVPFSTFRRGSYPSCFPVFSRLTSLMMSSSSSSSTSFSSSLASSAVSSSSSTQEQASAPSPTHNTKSSSQGVDDDSDDDARAMRRRWAEMGYEVDTTMGNEQRQRRQIHQQRRQQQEINSVEFSKDAYLTDSFARVHNYLRISLTERCNLRCQYCMPVEGVPLSPDGNLMTAEETMRLASLFVRLGVTKIRLTGGEPTVRRDIVQIVEGLGNLQKHGLQSLAMTTNGVKLTPRKVAQLADAGLQRVNISLDTLDANKFEKLARRPAEWHPRVVDAIHAASARLGATGGVGARANVKVNVVLMGGSNDDEIEDFVDLARDNRVDVRFIEYMPFTGNRFDREKLVSFDDTRRRVLAHAPELVRSASDDPSEVGKSYAPPPGSDSRFAGSVSFVTSMTQPFCGDCNRVRLLADGSLKVCLFGNAEVSLRDAMRRGDSDAQIASLIAEALGRKKARHAGLDALPHLPNRSMIQIGG